MRTYTEGSQFAFMKSRFAFYNRNYIPYMLSRIAIHRFPHRCETLKVALRDNMKRSQETLDLKLGCSIRPAKVPQPPRQLYIQALGHRLHQVVPGLLYIPSPSDDYIFTRTPSVFDNVCKLESTSANRHDRHACTGSVTSWIREPNPL